MSTLRADAAPFNPFMFRGPFSSVDINNTPSTTAKESSTSNSEQNSPTTNVSPLDLLQFIFTGNIRFFSYGISLGEFVFSKLLFYKELQLLF